MLVIIVIFRFLFHFILFCMYRINVKKNAKNDEKNIDSEVLDQMNSNWTQKNPESWPVSQEGPSPLSPSSPPLSHWA